MEYVAKLCLACSPSVMTGDPVASRRRIVSWTAASYSALSSGCEMRPARKPWTPSIKAAGLGMLPMGSVGSITISTVEAVEDVVPWSSSPCRQSEMEGGAVRRIRGRPEPSPMRLDDRTADRQPHAHAAGLGGEEGAEQLVHAVRIDPDAGILHGHQHLITLVRLRTNHQLARPVRDGRHRLDRIHDEVDEHLLQLDPITEHRSQGRRQVQP